jgi:iron complex transport system ATP-binding protein
MGIEVQGITIAFGDADPVLEDVSLSFQPGVLSGVIGPNGAGKSSLLRVVAGLWSPSTGEVRAEGKSLAEYTRRERAMKISWLPQKTDMSFGFTVHEMVMMGRNPHLGRFGRESAADVAAVENAMQGCGISGLRGRSFGQLSGGEQQRVMIARCFATDASYLLLDEPTASLDLHFALEVVAAGKGVVLVTHDMNLVARCCNHVVALRKGTVLFAGSVEDTMTADNLSETFGVRIAEVAFGTETGQRSRVFVPSDLEGQDAVDG